MSSGPVDRGGELRGCPAGCILVMWDVSLFHVLQPTMSRREFPEQEKKRF